MWKVTDIGAITATKNIYIKPEIYKSTDTILCMKIGKE